MEHDDIVTHVIALQEHISTLIGSTQKDVGMSAVEPDSKGGVVRKTMIAGLNCQMKVLLCLSTDFADTCAVERISETRYSKINLLRSGPTSYLFCLIKCPYGFQEETNQIAVLEFEKNVVKTWVRQRGPGNRTFLLRAMIWLLIRIKRN